MPDDDPEDLYKDYKQFLEPTNLVCRVYILKGKSLTPNDTKNSDPYLFIKCGSFEIDDEKNVIEDTNNPGFYKHFDIPVSIPGASTLKIEVWDDDGIVGDDLIGETRIDLEERWFSKEWRDLNDSSVKNSLKDNTKTSKSKELSENKNDQETVDKSTKEGTSNKDDNEEEKAKEFDEKEVGGLMKVPIEERTLVKKTSAAPQGILECWVELLSPKEAKLIKPLDVRPFPKKDFELRVIIWGTRDVKFRDVAEKCNDLYVKGKFGKEELDTDTHFRCRELGSFNWRWKYKLSYPFDYDDEYGRNIFTFSLWDMDIIKSNEMICE